MTTSSYQQFCVARSSRLEGDRYVTRISDKARVMSLQSGAQLLTNYKHTALISQLLRHQEIAHNASSIYGCVVVENKDSKVDLQEPFDEWVRLKRFVTTVGSVRFVYVKTRLRTAEGPLYIVFWNIKILVKQGAIGVTSRAPFL